MTKIYLDINQQKKHDIVVRTKAGIKKHLKKWNFEILPNPFEFGIKKFSAFEDEEQAVEAAINNGYFNQGEDDIDMGIYDKKRKTECHILEETELCD